jgi:HPt (histidine-containing phosphotransfer) domain-containing protein
MLAAGNGQASVEDLLRALCERAESSTAKALEEMVAKPSFGRLLTAGAENVVALTRIGSDIADLALRNLRVAGRADITRLARQLYRTEDKLERVLQELEELRDELAVERSRETDRS